MNEDLGQAIREIYYEAQSQYLTKLLEMYKDTEPGSIIVPKSEHQMLLEALESY